MNNATVIERDDGHYVVAGDTTLAGPFTTNAAAWRWLDAHTDIDREAVDTYNRIRMAFSGE